MSAQSPDAAPAPALESATLSEVDIVERLRTRPHRAPDFAREQEAFARLTEALARNPRNMLQELVTVAVELCGADTAGISLLDGEVFRWEAVAGVFAKAKGGTMPRDQSPCGVTIERNSTQLMHLADRCFPALKADPRFVEALLIPFHFNDEPVGTVWLVSHSEEKQFDSEHERILRRLSDLASAGWQLWKAAEKLQLEKKRMDDFIATLGHELRNPLGTISFAEGALRAKFQGNEGVIGLLDVVARQVRHVKRLVDDLLDTARMGSGKLSLQFRLIDFRTIVGETVETTRPQVEVRQHTLTIELGESPVFVEGDPVRLSQVVSNLVENASKYTQPNGKISVAVSQSEQYVALEVRDNGIGIAPESLKSIFEPFVQLPARQDRLQGGLGLGLALVNRLVELHGGTLEVTSPGLNQGSCFTVLLPLRQTQESSVVH